MEQYTNTDHQVREDIWCIRGYSLVPRPLRSGLGTRLKSVPRYQKEITLDWKLTFTNIVKVICIDQ